LTDITAKITMHLEADVSELTMEFTGPNIESILTQIRETEMKIVQWGELREEEHPEEYRTAKKGLLRLVGKAVDLARHKN